MNAALTVFYVMLGAVIAALDDLIGPYLIAVMSLFIIRWAVQWKVARLMRSHGGGSRAGPPSADEASEVPSHTRPTFVEIRAADNGPDNAAPREKLVARARRLFRMGLLRDTVAGMAFLWMPDLWLDVGVMTDAQLEPMFVLGYGTLLIVCLRFLYFRKQFRPLDADFAGPLVHPTFALARALARPSVFPFFVAAVLVYFGNEAGTGVVAVLGAVFAVYLLVAWWWRPDPTPNLRLLVLRVFGIDENATFTFGRLLEFWRHFGTYFTVVDASFIKHVHRFTSPRSAALAAAVALAAVVLYSWPNEYLYHSRIRGLDLADGALLSAGDAFAVWFWYRGHGPLAIVTTVVLAVAVEWRLLTNRMDRSRDELQHRLARLLARPRGHDLTFKAQPTPCFDDTWRMTVAEFTRVSDIVLMDLRGFSPQRQGCAYEVDFLFDTVPLDRVLFLLDADADRAPVHRLMLERWAHLRRDSPNLRLAKPEIRLYAAAAQDERDVQGILDALIGMAPPEALPADAAGSAG